MRETGKSKTCAWRWQERFADEGFEGLLRDKTRPSRIPRLDPSIAERVVSLTMESPPGETTPWTGAAMAAAAGISVSSVQRILPFFGRRTQSFQCPANRGRGNLRRLVERREDAGGSGSSGSASLGRRRNSEKP